MKQDVVIIGAGIIGLATAERLLKHGLKVAVLERGKIGRESSWAGGGILSPLPPWNYTDEVTRLTNYSANLFSEWTSTLHAATGIDSEYSQCGMLILPPYDFVAAKRWCSQNKVNFHQTRLPAPYSAEIDRISNDCKNTEQVISLPDIAQIRNPRLLRALHQHVSQLGGQIIENCTVHKIVINRDSVESVLSSCGQFVADNLIVAAGAWSKELLGEYALDLGIKPICGQMLLFKFDTLPLKSILVKGSSYIIPRKDGHILLGSTLEDTGFNKETTVSARKQLIQSMQPVLPQLHASPILRQWAGLRPASPENIPTISRHPDITNLYINSGHFRYGVTMAPASAEILSNAILGTPQPFDVTPYRWVGKG